MIVLITGAGSGLGKALALQYAEAGHHILLIGRNKANLEKVRTLIEEKGGEGTCLPCDITNLNAVEELVEAIKENYGHIHKLINNAGIGHFGPLGQLRIEEIDAMIKLNIRGTICFTQSLLPYIRHSILNIISTAGLRGKVNESVYCASKFAQRGFTESLQKELEDNIKVTGVYMGGMNTPFWNESHHIKDKSRLKDPQIIAKAIYDQDDGRETILL